ncbi:long-chain fatty acid--CoA ligase [Streptomyces sp. LBUM 1485]|nr:long-chain fatty acid--CoA ligase [Streptomyces sp. LBUM 1485]
MAPGLALHRRTRLDRRWAWPCSRTSTARTPTPTTCVGPPGTHRRGGHRLRRARKRLGPNEIGFIAVKTPTETLGYWNDPDLTHRSKHDGFWLTGDIGYYDEQGRFYQYDPCHRRDPHRSRARLQPAHGGDRPEGVPPGRGLCRGRRHQPRRRGTVRTHRVVRLATAATSPRGSCWPGSTGRCASRGRTSSPRSYWSRARTTSRSA